MIRGVVVGQDRGQGGGDEGASRSILERSQRGDWGFWERSLKISPGKQIRKTVFDEA